MSNLNTKLIKCFVGTLVILSQILVKCTSQDLKIAENATALSLLESKTRINDFDYSLTSKIQWLTRLFDHHTWDQHLAKVSSKCEDEMRIYVDALKNGLLWASKMSDASGHYNGNLLFGNDYWLGSINACKDYTLSAYNDILPPYETAFHVTRFNLTLSDGHIPQSRTILLGSCLPKTCSSQDIESILKSSANEHEKDSSGIEAEILVILVRLVPGPYKLLEDPKFITLGAVSLVTLVIIIIASFYEGYIERCDARELEGQTRDVEMSCQNNNLAAAKKMQMDATTKNSDTKFGAVDIINGKDSKDGDYEYSKDVEHNEVHQDTRAHTCCQRKMEDKSETGYGRGLFAEVLLSFSALSNGRKILLTEDPSDGTLTCIHGMRFLSVTWVIMVHTYLTLFYISDNKNMRTVTERNFMYQTVGNASYSVDTFFFISGLLVTILFYRSAQRDKSKKTAEATGEKYAKPINGEINRALSTTTLTTGSQTTIEQVAMDLNELPNKPILTKAEFLRNSHKFIVFMAYRFIRLSPAYLFVIGLSALASSYSHNNSVFEPILADHITCDWFWWRNILYINNLYPQREMCMVWSWYMANDTQFYVVGIILLLVSARFLKFSIISVFVLMISSWLTTIYISWSYKYKAKIQDPFEMFDPLYDKPWSRLGPYLVGMVVGWYLHRKECKVTIPVWFSVLAWPASLAIFGSLIFSMADGIIDVWPTAFYVSIGHTAWGVALAWVTIACCAGYGGLVNSALSYRGLLPLSRLTYCAYLVHPPIMMVSSFILDGPVHLQNGMVIVVFAGYAVMSFMVAFAISMAYEAPIVRLMKISIAGSRKKKN